MLKINKKAYVPLTKTKDYVGIEPDRAFELAKDKLIKYVAINGRFFVCLKDLKREKELSI